MQLQAGGSNKRKRYSASSSFSTAPVLNESSVRGPSCSSHVPQIARGNDVEDMNADSVSADFLRPGVQVGLGVGFVGSTGAAYQKSPVSLLRPSLPAFPPARPPALRAPLAISE